VATCDSLPDGITGLLNPAVSNCADSERGDNYGNREEQWHKIRALSKKEANHSIGHYYHAKMQ